MKAKLLFDMDKPEDREEFKHAAKGSLYHLIINEIHNECFRPARKHGYENKILQDLLNNKETSRVANLVIDQIEKIYLDIIENRGFDSE